MSTIRIGNVSIQGPAKPDRDTVTVLFVPSIVSFEDAIRPDAISAHRVHMPTAMWQAIQQLADVTKVADEVNKRTMQMDMTAFGEPFATLADVRGTIVNFVYKMGLRVTP